MSLLLFALRRAALSGVLLVALTVCTFVVFFRIPADPANFLVGDPQRATPEQRALARHLLGVDRPIHVQYAKYVERLVHGDLGRSWSGSHVDAEGNVVGLPVRDQLVAAAGVTGSVLLGGLVVLLLVSIPLGCYAAARPSSAFDRLTTAVTLAGISLHPLVLAIVLQTVVAERVGVLPDSGYVAFGDNSAQWAAHLVLPWLTFAAFFAALYARMVRARMLEVLDEPWTQTARAKGSRERRVLFHHALPNALPPVIAMVGMDVGTAAGVAVYVETVYKLPGIGTLLLRALSGDVGFDLPLLAGIVLLTAATIIVVNLAADVLTAVVDPTISRGRRSARGL